MRGGMIESRPWCDERGVISNDCLIGARYVDARLDLTENTR